MPRCRRLAALLLVAVAAGAARGARTPAREPSPCRSSGLWWDDAAPEDKPTYEDGVLYWDWFYTREEQGPYEWLQSYGEVRELVEEVTGGDRGAAILHPGCGSSRLSEEMHDDGYTDILNIDNCATVIERMRARNQRRPGLSWAVLDATRTSLPTHTFDAVIDKGVLDTFACMADPAGRMRDYLLEVVRVLRPGGALLCISFGDPESRLPHLNSSRLLAGSGVEVAQLELRMVQLSGYPGGPPHWAYIARTPSATTTTTTPRAL